MFRGGLAVFVRNGIPHSSIPPVVDHPSIESMDVSIHGPTETINLYNCCVHAGAMNKGITLATYAKIISNSSNKLVLLGYFNCKHVILGSSDTNSQGDIVDSLMEK